MLTRKEKSLFWLCIFALIIAFLTIISDILLPFIVGILVAYFLDPAADKLEKAGLSRTSATFVITLLFFFIIAISVAILLPILYDQSINLANKIPHYIEILQSEYGKKIDGLVSIIDPNAVDKAKEAATDLSGYILKFAGKMVTGVWESGVAFLNLLSLIFISPVVSFYLLRDWDKVMNKADNLLPREYSKTIREQLTLINETLAGYIRGQSNVCLLLGIFYAIGLSIVGLDFGLFIGLATGILAFIPFVGLFIGMATGIGVAYFQFGGDFQSIGMVVGVFVIGQFIEGNFVTPKLVGDKVGLHPVWIIFGLLAGGSLFGFTGILLAVPVTAVIGVLVRFMIDEYMHGSLYKGSAVKKKKKVSK